MKTPPSNNRLLTASPLKSQRNWLTACTIALCILLLPACKDDPEPGDGDPTIGNYITGGNGSMWTYKNQEVDSTGTATDNNAVDTLTLASDTVLYNQTAKWASHRFALPFGNFVSNTAHYGIYQTGSRLSVSSDFMSLFIPEMLQRFVPITGGKWMMLTNGNAAAGSEWVIDSIPFNNEPMNLEQFGIPVNISLKAGSTKITISRQADTTFNSKPAHYYKMKVFYLGSLSSTTPELSVLTAAGNFRIELAEMNLFFAEGTGLLGITAKPHAVSVWSELIGIKIYTFPATMTLPGFNKILLSSSIK